MSFAPNGLARVTLAQTPASTASAFSRAAPGAARWAQTDVVRAQADRPEASVPSSVPAPSHATVPAPMPPIEATAQAAMRAVEQFAREVSSEHRALDRHLTDGRTTERLSSTELLRLQVQVHRYTQRVDLAAKTVEVSLGTVRRVLDTPL